MSREVEGWRKEAMLWEYRPPARNIDKIVQEIEESPELQTLQYVEVFPSGDRNGETHKLRSNTNLWVGFISVPDGWGVDSFTVSQCLVVHFSVGWSVVSARLEVARRHSFGTFVPDAR